ncbi:phosphatase PAP2 family protein [Paraburkholderia sp. BR14320]|uniref:phosphatase PAP2 family protein n=1 Tax=unclassified Paraburkholderia TaxID=2615204 RepID=UPI0034CD79AF
MRTIACFPTTSAISCIATAVVLVTTLSDNRSHKRKRAHPQRRCASASRWKTRVLMLQHSGHPGRSITPCRSRRPQSRQGRQTIGITCACPLPDRTNKKRTSTMSSHEHEHGEQRGSERYLIRYLSGWAVVALVTALDGFWVAGNGYTVPGDGVANLAQAAAISMFIVIGLLAFAQLRRYAPLTRTLRCREMAVTLAWLTLLLTFVAAFDLLQYLCATVDAPLIDERLLAFDSAFGFHWPRVYSWVRSHPALQHILEIAYASMLAQGLAIPIILGLAGRRDELSEFVLLFMLSGLLLLLIATPLPASSAFLHFGIADPNTSATVSDFYPLRDGTLRTFIMVPAQGMVSMPSFHTTLGIVFIYALRRIPRLLLFAVPLNLTMILSTPTQGGHYLADVIAGLLLSALSIAALKGCMHLLATRKSADVVKRAVYSGVAPIDSLP